MKIKELQKNWDALGSIDAFGNILTDPAKTGKWKEEERAAPFSRALFFSWSWLGSRLPLRPGGCMSAMASRAR